jgi:hypothetical protein
VTKPSPPYFSSSRNVYKNGFSHWLSHKILALNEGCLEVFGYMNRFVRDVSVVEVELDSF